MFQLANGSKYKQVRALIEALPKALGISEGGASSKTANEALEYLMELLFERKMEIPVDLSDIRTLLDGAGKTGKSRKIYAGLGSGEGKDRAELSARETLGSMTAPPSAKFNMIIVCMETDASASLFEITKAGEIIGEVCDGDAQIITGHSINPGIDGAFKILVLAV